MNLPALIANAPGTSLEEMHGLILPEPPPFWPPAPGWWVLSGVAAMALLYGAITLLRRWQRNRYRREALALLRPLAAQINEPTSRQAALVEAATLLRRTALSAWPRTEVASLSGPGWFAFLDQHNPGSHFAQGPGPLLEAAVRAPAGSAAFPPEQALEAVHAVADWVEHHRAPHQHTEGAP